MTEHESMSHEFVTGAKRFVGHVIAIALGLVLMIAGVAMGVTLVLLPIGIPLGLVGLLLFIWGLFGWSREKNAVVPPGRS
jgi:hypothetical protein